MTATDAYDIAARYGVRMDGPQGYIPSDWSEGAYTLADLKAAGGRVSKVRVLAEYGRCDISYVQGQLADGTYVPINLAHMPSSGIGIPLRGLMGELIAWAKEEGVYAKGLGLLDRGIQSVLYG